MLQQQTRLPATAKKTQINVNWTNYEVAAIIDIWATVEIQGQLDGMRRNKKVYERISEEMAARGFVRTFKQCRNKIKWLKHEYKRVIDNNFFCACCIGKRDLRVVSATKMSRFFSRPCWADEHNMWQIDDATQHRRVGTDDATQHRRVGNLTLIKSRLIDKRYHFGDTLEKADRLHPIGVGLQRIDNSRPAPEQVVGMEVMEPLGP